MGFMAVGFGQSMNMVIVVNERLVTSEIIVLRL